jgi:hypothetical protein
MRFYRVIRVTAGFSEKVYSQKSSADGIPRRRIVLKQRDGDCGGDGGGGGVDVDGRDDIGNS